MPAKGHLIVPSASLVPEDDPTLIFTNAGMNQFKDYLPGSARAGSPPYRRLPEVHPRQRQAQRPGRRRPSPYHHTLVRDAGQLVVRRLLQEGSHRLGLGAADRGVGSAQGTALVATVFEDDKGDLGRDEEAAGFWRSLTDIDPAHVFFFGRKDNFWEMGETGPCGPCSEIHLDLGPDRCNKQDAPGHICRVNGDCRRSSRFGTWCSCSTTAWPDGRLHRSAGQARRHRHGLRAGRAACCRACRATTTRTCSRPSSRGRRSC